MCAKEKDEIGGSAGIVLDVDFLRGPIALRGVRKRGPEYEVTTTGNEATDGVFDVVNGKRRRDVVDDSEVID